MINQIGPYEIDREVGRGGMGVVYLARDTRLNRDVAIKALPPEVAADPVRLERFEREARTLASLSHTNLASIYGIEEQDNAKYLILEYIDGETLADRLDRGPLPVDDAIELAVQIAAGIEAAHDAGVIHRDLKPANIKITSEGIAKVLDFGLARQDDGSISSTGALDSPTLTTPQNSPTIEGAILGTAAYMSPEQARGRRVDKRTDIWSFAVVLYEMLVGASPFVGETASDSIGAVLHKDLDLAKLPPSTPASARRVLDRCLVRDKNQRYRDIGDVRLELLRPAANVQNDEPQKKRSRLLMPTVLLLALLMAAAALQAGRLMQPEAAHHVRKLNILNAGADESLSDASPQINPEGTCIAYIHEDMVYLRDLSSFDSRPLSGTDGAELLCWSPDSKWIAYATSAGIFKVPAAGGGNIKLADFDVSFQFAWTSDNHIIATNSELEGTDIMRIPARGGEPQVHMAADADAVIDIHAVTAIPGTDVVLFIRHQRDGRTPVVAWDGDRAVTLIDDVDMYLSAFAWSITGHVLYTKGFGMTDLWAVPFSPQKMEVTGEPFLVMSDADSPSVSSDGTLSVMRGATDLGGELIWVSFEDRSVELISDGEQFVRSPLISPDGSRLAFASGSNQSDMDLWVRDLERGINSRIADSTAFIIPVSWSQDSSEVAAIVFDPAIGADSVRTLFLAADGTGPTRDEFKGTIPAFDQSWTIGAAVIDPMTPDVQISAIDLNDMSITGDVVTDLRSFIFMDLNAEGTLLLFQSVESGKSQIFCTRFPSGEGRWQVSSDGGSMGVWAPDGSAVYYATDEGYYRVQVTYEPGLRFGVPELVLDASRVGMTANERISISSDGQRFVTIRPKSTDNETREPAAISVVENWFEEFRER